MNDSSENNSKMKHINIIKNKGSYTKKAVQMSKGGLPNTNKLEDPTEYDCGTF